MDNLMKLLGANKDKSSAPMEPGDDLDTDEETDPEAKSSDDTEGFKAAASEAMDAISSNDVDAFSDALKSCIEMMQ